MTSFPLKRTIFTPPFNPKFENALFALHPSNFVRRKLQQKANYSYKMFSLRPSRKPGFIR